MYSSNNFIYEKIDVIVRPAKTVYIIDDGSTKILNLTNGAGEYSIVQKYSNSDPTQNLPNKATAYSAIALGKGSEANAYRAVAMGLQVVVNGDSSLGTGQLTINNASGSFVTGNNVLNNGAYALVGGQYVINGNEALDQNGWRSIVGGLKIWNEGQNSIVSGVGITDTINNFVEPSNEGDNSVVSGERTRNTKKNSIIVGLELRNTNNRNMALFGKYNADKSGLLMSIGNGFDDNNRSNAFEVLDDGRAKVYGAPEDNSDVVRKIDLQNAIQNAVDKLPKFVRLI